jgi:F-type H+-transporting ATPase subunit epsilon
MAMTMHVDIVSAEEEIFSGQAEMLVASAVNGELGIMPRHTPLLTQLKPGEVRLKIAEDKDDLFYFISGGILEVQPHVVTVLADTVVRSKDFDEAAALKAKQQAEAHISNSTGTVEQAAAQAELMLAIAQLDAIKKFRSNKRGS